jgi:hypothetical protein
MLDIVGYLARNCPASFSFTPNIGDWIVVFSPGNRSANDNDDNNNNNYYYFYVYELW